MLHSISWQQYVVAVFLLSLAWYVYVGLRFYRAEVSAFLRWRPGPAAPLPEVSGPFTILGAARPEPGTGVLAPEELLFGAAAPDGPAEELLAEAAELIRSFSDGGDKAEFLSMLRTLISKYEVFAEEISLPAIMDQLKLKPISFTIRAEEWPLTFVS